VSEFDVVIAGAGPTGLACGIEVKRRGLRSVLLDKGCVVNSLYNYPTNMVFFTTPELLEIGDIPVFMDQGGTGEDFYRLIVDQFDVLYREGATNARILSIAVHPFLTGHAFRAKYFERALAHIKSHDQVWLATGSQILDWYNSGASGLDI